jgi:hypothetical protein
MVDELQLLRDVFRGEEVPDQQSWDLMNGRLSAAIEAEGSPRGVGYGRHDARRLPRRSLAVVLATAAVLIAGLVIANGGPSTRRQVVSVSPWRLASLVTIQPFQASPGSIQFANHVTCPTTTDCYLAARPLSAAAANNVYASTDAGGSWRQLTLPSGVYADTALSCTSATQCMDGGARLDMATGDVADGKPLADPVLLSTSDGGATWSVQAVPAPVLKQFGIIQPSTFNQLICLSTSTCLATLTAGFSAPGDDIAYENVFMRTDDGGRSWTSMTLPGQQGPGPIAATRGSGGEPPGSVPASMSCPSVQVCVAITDIDGTNATPEVAPTILWRTDDGGQTWSVGSLPDDRMWYGGSAVSCPDTEHCWVMASSSPKPYANDPLQLLESTDGGTTWNVRSPVGLPGTPSWTSVSCPTDNDCWLAGQTHGTLGSSFEGIVFATHDGGQTWSNVPLPTAIGPKSEPLLSIDDVDCNVTLSCVALGSPAGASIQGQNEAVLTNSPPSP